MVLDAIHKATESVSMNSVEQAAYFRAMGEKNNLNLEKFRGQVQNELAAKAAPAKKGNLIIFLNFIDKLHVECVSLNQFLQINSFRHRRRY